MGWDDNGLPTERRVQNYFGVRCDPALPYDPSFDPSTLERPTDEAPVAVSRSNFIELCERLTVEDEKAFEALFRRLGLSVDWTRTYTTIGERSRRISQRSFLRLLRDGHAYTAEAPTLWDIDFQTAVAQAEIEDRERDGVYHRITFDREDGGTVEIETSRPELIPACVALVVNPVGRSVRLARRHHRVDPAVPGARAGRGARARRPREGDRRRHDLHVRRRHRRHVVEGARPAGARRDAEGRHDRRPHVRRARLGVPRPRSRQRRHGRARGPAREEGARPDRRSAARCRSPGGRTATGEARREVLREGRPTARGHHEPAVVRAHPGAQGRAARPRRTDRLASGVHGRALRLVGRGPELGLGDQPPAVLRRAVPRLVPARRARQRPLRRPDPGR